ncbi:MAG TPA: cytochrome c oxidase assembly protein [Solirubrobacteraceae bacterium]|nr:cytochrome c oxidase assembly protein [Solirubrobacteraceae bacterium]
MATLALVASGVVVGPAPAGVESAIGWGSWSLDPPAILALLIAALYWWSDRRTMGPARTRRERRRRHLCFYTGTAVLLVALASPLDALSERLFWAHMTQHVLLLVVAPPLIVLARPWVRLWRVLPLPARQTLGRSLARGHLSGLRRLGGFLGAPLPTFVLFSATMLLWHVPALFDATLRSQALHAFEHTLFFVTALMFFKQAIDSPPLHAPLADVWRMTYILGAMVVMWVLAIVLALAPRPLYAPYAHEAVRPGGISALADQQIAAGVMWVPGSITLTIALFFYVHRWLAAGESTARAATPRLAGEHQ